METELGLMGSMELGSVMILDDYVYLMRFLGTLVVHRNFLLVFIPSFFSVAPQCLGILFN